MTVEAPIVDVVRTVRNTWHVINRVNGDQWECPTQQAVLDSIDEYKVNADKREQARLAALAAAANPPVAEFSSAVPFEFSPATQGKPIAPVISSDAPGAVPEPTETGQSGTITLTNEQFQQLMAAKGIGVAPEPPSVVETANAPTEQESVTRGN